jgi:2-iminoacetate synthase ThiH
VRDGGRHGQALTLQQMADAIRRAGRTPVRRDTLYHYLDAPVPKCYNSSPT